MHRRVKSTRALKDVMESHSITKVIELTSDSLQFELSNGTRIEIFGGREDGSVDGSISVSWQRS